MVSNGKYLDVMILFKHPILNSWIEKNCGGRKHRKNKKIDNPQRAVTPLLPHHNQHIPKTKKNHKTYFNQNQNPTILAVNRHAMHLFRQLSPNKWFVRLLVSAEKWNDQYLSILLWVRLESLAAHVRTGTSSSDYVVLEQKRDNTNLPLECDSLCYTELCARSRVGPNQKLGWQQPHRMICIRVLGGSSVKQIGAAIGTDHLIEHSTEYL